MKFTETRKFYFGVFAASGLLMALQILQSRIFSVTTWYHISFLVISVAMFGLTMGALHVHKGNEKEQRKNYGPLMAKSCRLFGLSMIAALIAQLFIPMIIADNIWGTLITLPAVSYFVVWPYYYAGVVLSLAITRAPYPVSRTYGIDLVGAAMGCLFALGIMHLLDAPAAVLLLSVAAVYCAQNFSPLKSQQKSKVKLEYVLLALVALNFILPLKIIFPIWVKDTIVPEWSLAHDEWNAISRVTVYKEKKDVPPFMWGPSKKLPDDIKISYHVLQMDGNAATPIYKYKEGMDLDFLDYDVTTLAYALPGLKNAGIIGLGGGRDVLSAHHAGVSNITAIDVNNVQVKLLSRLEPFASYAGIRNIKGVDLIYSEARSWFSRTDKKFDIIQMSLIDTWASTGAGAFALSENGLYTQEALQTFLSHLNPGGVLTVSRWYLSDAHSETERLLSLASASLLAAGAKHPEQHIYMASSGYIATLVLARDPLTKSQIGALNRRAREMEFTVLLSPEQTPENKELASILHAKSVDDLYALNKSSVYDISPPTDLRPFFFNQVRLTQPGKVFQLILENSASTQLGHARAIFNLYLIITFSAAMVIGVILYPLRTAITKQNPALIVGGTMWFFLIGLGFMLIEISLLQRMSVYLGHPSYGLGIVLFSVILSTGIGSLVSGYLPLKSFASKLVWVILSASAVYLSIGLIDSMFIKFSDAAMVVRILICMALTFPVGILLGYGFPTGMELVSRSGKNLTAWFWGINGAAGVMGSAIAISISIAAGLDTTMAGGALCYGLLLIPVWILSRHKAY